MRLFNLRNKSNPKLYTKIFFPLIICTVVTLLISSTIFYVYFEKIALNLVYSYDLENLSEASRNAAVMNNTVRSFSQQLFNDLSIERLMYYNSVEIPDMIFSNKLLDNYRMSMPFIKTIYVYNGSTKTFYISSDSILNAVQPWDDVPDKGILDIISNCNIYRPDMPIPRKVVIRSLPSEKTFNCYTFLNYNVLTNGKKVSNAVAVDISEEWILNSVKNSKIGGSETYIIDSYGKLASSSHEYDISTAFPKKHLLEVLKVHPSASGYFVTGKEVPVKSLVTYTAPDSLGWRYLRITPYATITSKIVIMKITTICIALIILLLSFVISYVLSKKLYKPIGKMAASLITLENEKKDAFFILKQEFLRGLLFNKEINIKEVSEAFSNFKIAIDPDENFFILLLKIDNYSKFCRDNCLKDRALLRFGIANIACELCSEHFNTEAIDLGEDVIVLMLNTLQEDFDVYAQDFISMLKNIQTNISQHMHLSLSISISTIENDITEISYLYDQVSEASLYRMFRGHGCIIHAAETVDLKLNEYVYPVDKEKYFIDHLMAGKISEAKAIYLNIINNTASYPFTVINLAISHLTFTVNNIINTIEKNNLILSHSNSSFITFDTAETLEDINNQFFALFEDIRLRLDRKKNSKHDELIKKINDMIDTQYANPDLSINVIADLLDMSSVYLGRLYKQYTLVSVGDYISEVRINKAKELLLENKYSVCEISEKIGFLNSSYFYKVFKKFTSVTPNDFRRNVL